LKEGNFIPIILYDLCARINRKNNSLILYIVIKDVSWCPFVSAMTANIKNATLRTTNIAERYLISRNALNSEIYDSITFCSNNKTGSVKTIHVSPSNRVLAMGLKKIRIKVIPIQLIPTQSKKDE